MHQQGPGLERGTRTFFPTTSGTPNALTHRWSCCGDHTWGQTGLRQGGPPTSVTGPPPRVQEPPFQSAQNVLDSSRWGFLNLGSTGISGRMILRAGALCVMRRWAASLVCTSQKSKATLQREQHHRCPPVVPSIPWEPDQPRKTSKDLFPTLQGSENLRGLLFLSKSACSRSETRLEGFCMHIYTHRVLCWLNPSTKCFKHKKSHFFSWVFAPKLSVPHWEA